MNFNVDKALKRIFIDLGLGKGITILCMETYYNREK